MTEDGGMTMNIRRVLSALAVSAAAGMGFLVLSGAPATAGPIYYCNGVKQYTPCPPKEPMECVPVKNGTHCYPAASPPKTTAPKPPPPPVGTTPADPPAPPANQPGHPAPDKPSASRPNTPTAPPTAAPSQDSARSNGWSWTKAQDPAAPSVVPTGPVDATDLAFRNERLRPRCEWIAL